MISSRDKDEAIRLIQSLPDDCSLEDIQYHLYVRQKVERGIQAAEEGCVVPQEEAERRVAEWARSRDRARAGLASYQRSWQRDSGVR